MPRGKKKAPLPKRGTEFQTINKLVFSPRRGENTRSFSKNIQKNAHSALTLDGKAALVEAQKLRSLMENGALYYSMLRRKLLRRSCFGLPSTSAGVPCSAMTP